MIPLKPLPKKLDISAHIAAIRAKDAANPKSAEADDALLYWGSFIDKDYLPHLKSCVGSSTVFVRMETVTTLSQVTMYCRQKHITRVISSSVSLLAKVLNWNQRAAPQLSSYAGSYFTLPAFKEGDPPIELVFIAPLKQLITVPFGKFTAKRVVNKLKTPDSWYKPTKFTGFDLLTADKEAELYYKFKSAVLISIDVETLKEDAQIKCLSYTGFFYSKLAKEHISISVVLPLDSDYAVSTMRKWNLLPAPKVGQNFKYDIAYFARYNAPVYNYLYDTAHLFHCWYSELPKDLGFLNSFFIREAVYWKDLAKTNDLYEYYRYNALDTWGTGNCFLAMLLEAPEFAINNYLLEFPLVFPCHLSEMTGIERDMTGLEKARIEQQGIVDTIGKTINTMLSIPEGEVFNVKSHLQKKALFKLLGCSDLPSQDEKNIKKAIFRHPLNARILRPVLAVIKARTLVSNYLTVGKEFKRQDGTGNRYLYSLNPHGTDTSRLASKSHHFWCGDNVQKIPRGPIVKQSFRADPGFHMAECDLEQAESRDTGYISGDPTLIQNVEHSPDFHCSNAAAFFGVPFEEMFNVATGKVLNKPLRQLGKPVNHGANYNMGAFVLIDTMGEEKVLLAKQLLGLPRFWSYLEVANYLLEQFHKTYPFIKKVFYEGVKKEIAATRKLSSTAVHHSWTHAGKLHELMAVADRDYSAMAGKAWVRYCFSNPEKSKPALNAYIAHPPQSLNAQTLNKSYLSVFHDIAIHPKHSSNFKLNAQIHDSILFQYRIGHEYLCDMVSERMEVPVTLKGYDGEIRTFVVPAGVKRGLHLEQGHAKYWSETE
jgi:DNA polymerase I-like protein with 3'-5' exonuclease and polymerase domains